MAYEFITYEKKDRIARITINRPEVRNALHPPANLELSAAFDDFAADPEAWVAIITGTGDKAFSAGNDLKFSAEHGMGAVRMGNGGFAGITARFDLFKPVIAAVNGFALGGGFELAMLADILIVGEGAKLGLPEIKVGVMPGGGGTQRLTRLAGKHKAMLMALTGRMISGREAEAWGIASLCVADAEVLKTALEIAAEIAALPPIGAQLIKEAILAGADQSLDAALAFERRSFQLLFATEDRREGIAAFLEKRKPNFR
jgi:crotonobetainyl-CoA hydratase